MSAAELALLNSVIKNKDILPLINNDVNHIFENFTDVAEFLEKYYHDYKTVPSFEFLQERFPDFDEVETSGPVKFYLDKAEDQYLETQLEKILVGAAENLSKVGPRRIIEGLEKKVSGLKVTGGNMQEMDITDYESAAKHYKEVEEKVKENDGTIGINTGFPTIDYHYPTGMAPGHKITLIGWPSKGKSWFAGLLAVQAWLQGYKPMVVSLEMSTENMRDRLYTMMGQGKFLMSGLVRGDVDEFQFKEWGRSMLEGKQPLIVISGDSNDEFTPRKLDAKIDRYQPDLVIVDYLQLMSDNGHTKDATPRNMNLSRELKNVAVARQVAIIDIASATSKDIEDREKSPDISQVAWSKSIEYDADLAMSVHRFEDSGLVEIVCRKNRHGDMFAFYLDWDINRGIVQERHE